MNQLPVALIFILWLSSLFIHVLFHFCLVLMLLNIFFEEGSTEVATLEQQTFFLWFWLVVVLVPRWWWMWWEIAQSSVLSDWTLTLALKCNHPLSLLSMYEVIVVMVHQIVSFLSKKASDVNLNLNQLRLQRLVTRICNGTLTRLFLILLTLVVFLWL